jgi:TRAP-type C4-dicarboxylate transport system permease small subunit
MNALLTRWWQLLEALGRLERALGIALIITIVVSITIQVFTRYVFGQPLVWVEELAGYCFLWSVFIGASLGMKQLRHIRIETFVSRLGVRGRSLWRAVSWLLVCVIASTVAFQAWDIMEVESRSRTISLPVDLPRHLFYSVPLFYCMASIAFTGAQLLLSELISLMTGRPADAELARATREQADREAEAQAELESEQRAAHEAQLRASQRGS